MARKFFLASVGNAEGYAKEDGVLKRVLSARTLTESTLGFTSSMEEVRAGQGAKLYGLVSLARRYPVARIWP